MFANRGTLSRRPLIGGYPVVPACCHLEVRRGCAMFDEWDNRFDLECGAEIGSVEADDLVDSGVRDWLYGSAAPAETEPGASLLAAASQTSSSGRVSLRLVT